MPTDQQIQVKTFLEQFESWNKSLDQILANVQQTIASVDHLDGMVQGWQEAIAAKTLDAQLEPIAAAIVDVDALTGTLADLATLKAALAAYRDNHQGV